MHTSHKTPAPNSRARACFGLRPGPDHTAGTRTVATILGILGLLTVSTYGDPVNKEKAGKAAATFISKTYPAPAQAEARTVTAAGRSHLGIKKVDAVEDAGRTLGFVASLEPSGYVLLASDDDAPAIKLHSERGSFDDLPPGLLKVLRLEMAEDLSALAELKQKKAVPNPKHKKKWTALASADAPAAELADVTSAAANTVLLTTTWGQGAPYNEFCPAVPGGRVVAGCNAIAIAQILRYWQYPMGVSRNRTYTDASGTSMGTYSITDAGTGAYDWGNMPNWIDGSSSSAQRRAVSQLVYHAAVAIGSDFEAGNTTAGADQHPSVFSDYFDCSTAGFEWRMNFTTAQWFNKVVAEITASRPISYGMWDDTPGQSAGHSLVCDGHRNGNEIHLNFGWSGGSDAWYNIDGVNGGGFNWTRHAATFGIAPRHSVMYVNRAYTAADANGTAAKPYPTVTRGYQAATKPMTIRIGGGNYPESITISRPMHLESYNGPATIGAQ